MSMGLLIELIHKAHVVLITFLLGLSLFLKILLEKDMILYYQILLLFDLIQFLVMLLFLTRQQVIEVVSLVIK